MRVWMKCWVVKSGRKSSPRFHVGRRDRNEATRNCPSEERGNPDPLGHMVRLDDSVLSGDHLLDCLELKFD